jgi:RimJ/RimL family protein N-acetyltransferase
VTGLQLRPASGADAALLWELRNEDVTRLNSFDTTPIPWTSHVEWLERKLGSRTCRIWIVENDTEPVGQVRFERQDGNVVVNYSIDARYRGRGLGTAVLNLSVARACSELGARAIAGIVKTSNIASCRAFASAGFVRTAEVVTAGCHCVRFERPCGPSLSDHGIA